MRKFPLLATTLLLLCALPTAALDLTAKDSLAPAAGANAKQTDFLRRATWKPATFTVSVVAEKQRASRGEAQVSFPSPKPGGNAKRDTVVAHWFQARGKDGQLLKTDAPIAVVVHSLHPQMIDGFVLARLLASHGVHALMVELPGYGRRQAEPAKSTGVEMAEHAAQAVADVRRARDAATALPGVTKDRPVALEGLSLGSMVASAAAGLDNAFAPVVLVACGGDPVTALEQGRFDALWFRQRLAHAGYTGDKLHALLDPMDPLTVAGRINPAHCWMFRAEADGVFPQKCGDRLEQAVGLPQDHVITKPGNHYAAMLWLPEIAGFMAGKMK